MLQKGLYLLILLVIDGCLAVTSPVSAATVLTATNADWIRQPLSLVDCLNIALSHNSTLLKSQQDVQAALGVAIQTRAILIPKVQGKSSYQVVDEASIDRFPFGNGLGPIPISIDYPDQSWSANVQIVQSIYEGGRLLSAVRSARFTREQALLRHQAVTADTLLEVRVAYADVLLAAQQVIVQEASTNLLNRELEDTRRRFEAGTVPRFNVLRAEVELANANPRVIRAKNLHRIAKNNLANVLGCQVPRDIWEDLPLQLTGRLEAEPYEIALPAALAQALERRPELAALRKAESLSQERIVNAQAGYRPSVQLFTGYGSRNSSFSTDLSRDVSGWFAGGQLQWNLFDGLLTRGRVDEAKAQRQKARLEIEDTSRRLELEVRTAYSNFIEAKDVLESQKKVVEQAEEALRLATARSEAGTGTQLDVLGAQTSLTEARTTQVLALHDYVVARARLERAVGQDVMPSH
jgi:outer membrane protein